MRILALILLTLFCCSICYADWTENRVGNLTFVTGDNGYSGTANQVGDSTFYTDNRGNNITCNRVGSSTFCG